MTVDHNKRKFHRIFYNAQATLSSDDKSTKCEIIDISLKGCLLRFEESWKEDLEHLYSLSFQLSAEIQIKMELAVAHIIDNNVGFKCEHIDIDSISQLRRLVELNLGDCKLLERDLLALTQHPESESSS